MLDLDETRITEAVLEAMANTPDSRVQQIMRSLVRHLHDFIREVALTESEWATAIDFLTRTGQMCTPERQEFILMSDVLGATVLLDAVNNRRSPQATENSVLGPFFRQARPSLQDGTDISEGLPGDSLYVHARVTDTAGCPVAGAMFDVWHSDAEGHYDSDIDGLNGAAMRGQFLTQDDGSVRFRTIAPASYPIPEDGPVGDLMRATERSVMRPAHMHVRVEAPGFSVLTTMLFRKGDPYLDRDPVFGAKKSLVADFVVDERASQHLEYTFVLQPLV